MQVLSPIFMEQQPLIAQLQGGSHRAFQQLVYQWQNRLYTIVCGFVHNHQDAEDVTQEVFIEVHRSVKQFKGQSAFSTWLYRIAVNKSLEHLRKKKSQKRCAYTVSLNAHNNQYPYQLPNPVHPGIEAERKEQAQMLFNAIDQLAANQKVAFTLHKIEGLPYQQVAGVMGISVSAVESLLFRAKKNLQKLLHHYYTYAMAS